MPRFIIVHTLLRNKTSLLKVHDCTYITAAILEDQHCRKVTFVMVKRAASSCAYVISVSVTLKQVVCEAEHDMLTSSHSNHVGAAGSSMSCTKRVNLAIGYTSLPQRSADTKFFKFSCCHSKRKFSIVVAGKALNKLSLLVPQKTTLSVLQLRVRLLSGVS